MAAASTGAASPVRTRSWGTPQPPRGSGDEGRRLTARIVPGIATPGFIDAFQVLGIAFLAMIPQVFSMKKTRPHNGEMVIE